MTQDIIQRCPFCQTHGVDRYGFQVLTCPKCGTTWIISGPTKDDRAKAKGD